MTINFHDNKNKYTYAARIADNNWITLLESYTPKKDFTALDLGCGGGIYSKALIDIGASVDLKRLLAARQRYSYSRIFL